MIKANDDTLMTDLHSVAVASQPYNHEEQICHDSRYLVECALYFVRLRRKNSSDALNCLKTFRLAKG
jgi:hypothetical protein